MAKVVKTKIDARGVATVTLNRPERNNAYNGEMIDALAKGASKLAADSKVRVVVLRGKAGISRQAPIFPGSSRSARNLLKRTWP